MEDLTGFVEWNPIDKRERGKKEMKPGSLGQQRPITQKTGYIPEKWGVPRTKVNPIPVRKNEKKGLIGWRNRQSNVTKTVRIVPAGRGQ